MRLFHKIFLCFALMLSITFQIAGYLLINFAYGNAISQEKKLAFQEFQYNRYILQSILYSNAEFFSENDTELSGITRNFTAPIAILEIDGNYIFTNMAIDPRELGLTEINEEAEDDRISFQICEQEGKYYILVFDYVSQDENNVYLITQTDISSVIRTQKSMITYFQRIYIAVLCISFPAAFFITRAITSSLNKVGKATRRIAGGKYSERIRIGGQDEISELAYDFNRMAGKVEEKIRELSDVAKQKEDFAANFAHELKTPLTSVIGYADMLYQRDLTREEVKSAAGYILSEGMRLESLSLKMMDLFVLNKQEFVLEKISVREIFENLMPGIEPSCKKYGAELHIEMEEGSIRADYDLFKTMILNLTDNALKADGKDIRLTGREGRKTYRIRIKDNGKGIPPEELDRITEAFYMVDKSRSRRQHGAGIGMSLVSKIVEIHGAKMKIESDGKSGTVISIIFPMQED